MKKTGFLNWSIKQRPYIRKITFKHILYEKDFPVSILATDEALGHWACDALFEGSFYAMGYSHGKTKTGVKLVRLFDIYIKNCETYKYHINNKQRLSRYWYRREAKKKVEQHD